jgi:hypothetical protein
MRLVLNEQECMRAIEFYMQTKVLGDGPERELTVKIIWRGKSALVESRRPIPTLTDVVEAT